MMRIRITMDWTPPIWMDAETAKKEAIKVAKDAGFVTLYRLLVSK